MTDRPPIQPLRIAMWSGPRNISTALLRAWENRPDTAVLDEPFYAHYLHATGIAHPGRDEIVAACETDWRRVVAQITGPVPGAKPVFYQKHMTHHMLPGIDEGWLDEFANVFLIRDPRAVIASYAKRRDSVTLEDIGFGRQLALFQTVRRRTGTIPLVIDAAQVLADPAGILARLCAALGLDFDDRMLGWPAGPRPTDGAWAKYWYHAVERSTGFQASEDTDPDLPPALEDLARRCVPYYRDLRAHLLNA